MKPGAVFIDTKKDTRKNECL